MDSFTYTTSDGIIAGSTATVTIHVTNTPPVAYDDAYSVAHGQTLSVPPAGVLSNDFDAEGDPLTVTLQSPPSVGSLSLNPDGSFTYSAPSDFVGEVTFTYTASDGIDASNTATVTITVTNASPTPQDDSYSVD